MQSSMKTGIALAAAAAALFATTLPAAAADKADAKVKCSGANGCKGSSDCKTAKSGCKGQNACKGQGWVHKASEEECTKAGGKVVSKPAMIQGFGLGARSEHYLDLVRAHDEHWGHGPQWLECISENFMVDGGAPLHHLEQLRERYPLALHGVSLNLGSTTPLREDYLYRLEQLIDRVEPAWVSDHLCWTGSAHGQLHDLLPLPYSREALAHLLSRVQQVQERLRRPLVVENVSSYVQFAADEMGEAEFIAELVRRSGCKLLLDVNNVYVSHRNHGFDPRAFIAAMPADAVWQIHLAGHEDQGELVIDTHDAAIREEVWELYAYTLQCIGMKPTMIERDDKIPPLRELLDELDTAREIAETALLTEPV